MKLTILFVVFGICLVSFAGDSEAHRMGGSPIGRRPGGLPLRTGGRPPSGPRSFERIPHGGTSHGGRPHGSRPHGSRPHGGRPYPSGYRPWGGRWPFPSSSPSSVTTQSSVTTSAPSTTQATVTTTFIAPAEPVTSETTEGPFVLP